MAGKKAQNAAITPYLAAIGNAIVTIDEGGEGREVTNYALLAEQMWNWAMGWTEQVPVMEDGEQKGTKSVYHPPDKSIAKEIYARMEGKPKQSVEVADEHKAKPVPLNQRLDDQITARLNKRIENGERTAGSGSSPEEIAESEATKARPVNAISNPPRLLEVREDRAGRSKETPRKPILPPKLNGGRSEG